MAMSSRAAVDGRFRGPPSLTEDFEEDEDGVRGPEEWLSRATRTGPRGLVARIGWVGCVIGVELESVLIVIGVTTK